MPSGCLVCTLYNFQLACFDQKETNSKYNICKSTVRSVMSSQHLMFAKHRNSYLPQLLFQLWLTSYLLSLVLLWLFFKCVNFCYGQRFYCGFRSFFLLVVSISHPTFLFCLRSPFSPLFFFSSCQFSLCVALSLDSELNHREFHREVQILKSLRHRHLICLFAVCTASAPYYIITELMEKGSLLHFLRGKP